MKKELLTDSKYVNFRYVPRWVILSIDLLLIILSSCFTHYLLMGLSVGGKSFLGIEQLFLIIGFHLLAFLYFKPFSGIIRHSSFFDAVKLALAIFAANIALVVFNYVYVFNYKEKLFLNTELLVNMFFSFTLLFSLRLIVKETYEIIKRSIEEKEHCQQTLIIGFNENAVAIANAIEKESPRRFILKGFVTTEINSKASNLRVLGKKITYLNSSQEIIEELKEASVNSIILTDLKYSSAKLFDIVDFCTQNDITVYKAPLVSNSKEDISTKRIESIRIEDLLNRPPIQLNKENKVKEFYDKVILVTGGAGSIGGEIVRQLATYKPKKLVVLDQAETPLHSISIEIENKFKELDFECIICDVYNKQKLENLFESYNFDIVFHAAAYKHVPLMEINPTEAISVNVFGTKNLADLSHKFNVAKFVMVSTDKAVNPSNVMGASKRIAELYVQSFFNEHKNSTKFITTRFGNVLGSNGSVVPLFKRQIESGGPLTITHPDIIRYFMTIPEACNLVLEAGTMGNGGEIYLFDMGDPVKIMDLAKRMIRMYGYEPEHDIEIKITGLRKGEKLYEELLSDKSKTLTTHNDKIMIAKDQTQSFSFVNKLISEIGVECSKNNNSNVVKKMKELVPEFKSLNSEYEILDI